MQDLAREVELFQNIIKAIGTVPLSNSTIALLKDILLHCLKDVNELRDQLQELAPATYDGLKTKSWKAIRTVLNEETMKTLLLRMESHKNSLSLLLQQQHG